MPMCSLGVEIIEYVEVLHSQAVKDVHWLCLSQFQILLAKDYTTPQLYQAKQGVVCITENYMSKMFT